MPPPAAAEGEDEENVVCDICWMKKTKTRFKLKCKTCGLRVHPACYQISEFDEKKEWECWACQAVGTTVKFRERHPKTGERLTYKVKERPTECCLCSEPDSDNMHAMHQLFDDYGSKARQIRLKNGKPAWVHTLCAFFASLQTGGVIYGCTKDGDFGSSPSSDKERKEWDDDSVNSELDYGDDEVPTGNTHHFAYVTDLWYDPKKQGHIKKLNFFQKKSAKDGGCIGCGKNDVGSYRVAIQCMVGEARELDSLKTHNGQPIHNDSRCSVWWHAGCARYKKNQKGEYPGCQNVFFYPGGTKEHRDQVCNLFCREHAEEKYVAFNENRGILDSGKRKFESHYPEGCKIESRIGDSGSEASGTENEYSAPSDDDYDEDDDDQNLAFGLGGEGNDDEDEDDDLSRKRMADQEVDVRHQRQRKRKKGNDQEQPQALRKRKEKSKKKRDQAEDNGASSGQHGTGYRPEPKSRRIRSQEHYHTVDGTENEDSIVENDCYGYSLKYIDKIAKKAANEDKAQKLGRKVFRTVISDAVFNYRRVIIGENDNGSSVAAPFDDPFDSAVIGALFDENDNNDQNQNGGDNGNINETSTPNVPTAWCQLKQVKTDGRDEYEADRADIILRRFSFHSLKCLQKTTKTADYCDECKKIKDKFKATLRLVERAVKESQRALKEETQDESRKLLQDDVEKETENSGGEAAPRPIQEEPRDEAQADDEGGFKEKQANADRPVKQEPQD
mmetsp:Transcript_61372/g.150210  ORF Transcript_61372/g.150210 Transcript_61372/m.150210 type:complete len:729 (+) Transcript_61372:235-2421(+)|eukprot:CAMPEP_0113522484 /NCGR_PEP_ID=MMETSP0014_2-20120614/45213_1 /TAXON_ID=2857 /ORGANISM="Nitzschia sp." /LENGTH=728 /DNA_ID=CAMNT_0000420543 /DNA_START=221 /DNA_END=2407 /DNA_ORIENTATION=+ /assembly_acc=CAM_ASM_000159